MSLPLKIIISPITGECICCHEPSDGIRISLFAPEAGTDIGPICVTCLEDEVVNNVLLKEYAPPVSRRHQLRRQQRTSQKQEVEVAEALGARTQKASGALPGSKGDGRKKGVLRFEAKFTEAKSFPLKLDDLYKIASECHGTERPVLVLDFKEKGTGKLRGRYAILHFDDAKEMFNVGHDR